MKICLDMYDKFNGCELVIEFDKAWETNLMGHSPLDYIYQISYAWVK